MARAASKILGAAEVKALDLDKQIEEAKKEAAAKQKEFSKAVAVYDKLLAKRDKAEAKKKPKQEQVEHIRYEDQ